MPTLANPVPRLFAVERGIFLMPSRLALDVTRRQRLGFISHAHMDHVGRHELALCTPETAALVRHRLGKITIRELAYGQPAEVAGLRLTTLPAGHVLGSAMLRIEDQDETILYTGDFRLGPSATAKPAELPQADYLIMECTFGHPRYRLPPRDVAIEMLLEGARTAIRRGATPVVHAYVLGKAQEVSKIFLDAGIPVLQHPDVYAITEVYQSAGCDLSAVRPYQGQPIAGSVVIAPPPAQKSAPLEGILHRWRIGVTGWAMGGKPSGKWQMDQLVPLSDHADYDQLLETVVRVDPKIVYCTHGPKTFVDELKSQGHDARWLG